MIRKNLIILAMALIAVLPLGATTTQSPPPTLDSINSSFSALGFAVATDTLPSINFQLKDLKGVARQLTDYRGKVVFLNFWATWCPPCRAEIPSMQSLYSQYSDKGLEIVAVNLGERKNAVEGFVKQYGMTFPVLLDETHQVGSMYGARSIPTSYFIDRNGNILSMFVGATEWDTPGMRKLIEDLLAY